MKFPVLSRYPLSETSRDSICGPGGIPIEKIRLDALSNGEVGIEDLRISREALLSQDEIARAAGRETLAANFERGAELVDVPQEVIMQTYEMLRPGRVSSWQTLTAQAALLRAEYNAVLIAEFIHRAADVYLRRGLLKKD